MAFENFDKLIGERVEIAKKQLENKGYNVQIQKSSKPKIKTDSELVVQVRMLGEKQVLLVVGDFLINVEGNYGLV